MEEKQVDAYIGRRIRERRTAQGLSQTALGQALGVSFQQIQKYENGANRVSASRLYRIAQVLDIDVGYFFGTPSAGTPQKPRQRIVRRRWVGGRISRRSLALF